MSASPARRRLLKRRRDAAARANAHDFERSVCAMQAFRGADGVPLFASRCPVCDIPLTWTIKRDGETLCLMEHVQPSIEWGGRHAVGIAVKYDAINDDDVPYARFPIIDATARKTKRGGVVLW